MAKTNKKKSLSTLLVVVLLAVVAIGGMLAYLTDEGEKHNVFSVGNVDITLDEEVGVIGEGGGSVEETEAGAEYTGVMPGDKLIKKVVVKNEGTSDAYVRVDVTLKNANGTAANLINKAIDGAYESKYGVEYTQGMYDYIFDGWGINYNPRPGFTGKNNARGVIDDPAKFPNYVLDVDFTKTTDVSNDTFMFDNDNWFMSEKEKAAAAKGGYSTSLAKDGYYAKELGDYEIRYTYYIDLEAGDSTKLFNGLNVPSDFDENQLAMFNGLIIDVKASAIQKANFDSAEVAFVALTAEEDTTFVHTADQLVDVLNNGDAVTLGDDIDLEANQSNGYGKTGVTVDYSTVLDGAGNTLNVSKANTTWDSAIDANSGTIKNLTVNGAFRGIFMGGATGNVYIDNVVIDEVCYTFNSDAGNKDYGVYISNSTLNGWTSYSDVHKEVVFTNCNFGKGTGGYKYAFCRPYNKSVFKNCTFEEGYEFDTTKTSNITFENCYYGNTKITSENAETLGNGGFFYNGLNNITIK